MSHNSKKRKKPKRPNAHCSDFQVLGIVLLAFGAMTICAFLLPIKAWVFLLGCILLFCGFLLIYN